MRSAWPNKGVIIFRLEGISANGDLTSRPRRSPRDGVHREPRRVASSQVSVLNRKEGPTGTRGRCIGSRVVWKQGRREIGV